MESRVKSEIKDAADCIEREMSDLKYGLDDNEDTEKLQDYVDMAEQYLRKIEALIQPLNS